MIEGWLALARLFPLLLLSPIVTQIVTALYVGIKRRIDARLPDDMPLGAGPWLEGEIARRGLEVRVVIDPLAADEGDSFLPGVNAIVLSREAYRKADASFWAVAAHELGHAEVYRKSVVLRAVFACARVFARAGSAVAMTLLVANVFYRIASVDRLAFDVFRVALVAHVVVIVDEVSASIFALRTLRAAGLARRSRLGAFARLLSALATYVAAFAAQLVVVIRGSEIARQIEEPGEVPVGSALALTTRIAVVGLALAIVALATHTIVRAVRPRRSSSVLDAYRLDQWQTRREIVRGVVACILVLFVWDQPDGLVLEVGCVAAVVGSQALLDRIAAATTFVIATIVSLVAQPFVIVWQLVTKPEDPPIEAASPPVDQARYDAIMLAYYNDQPWLRRASSALFATVHLVVVGVVLYAIAR